MSSLSGRKRPLPSDTDQQRWTLTWDQQQDEHRSKLAMAKLYAHQDCQVAIQGRGQLCGIVDCGENDNDEVVVNGFRLPFLSKHDDNDESKHRYFFDCPTWSSWITLSLTAGAIVPIIPTSPTHTPQDGENCHNNKHASFHVWSAHDPQARPTVIPPSWKQAVQAIQEDFWQRHYLDTAKQQQKHLLIHRDSLEDDEHISECRRQRHQIMDCFQVVFCGAKNVGKSTCLRYCLNQLLSSSSASTTTTTTATTAATNAAKEKPNKNTSTKTAGSASTINMEAVAVLDADVGQSELGPPGMLTLTLRRQPLLQQPHCQFLYDSKQQQTHDKPLSCNHSNNNDLVDAYFFGATSSQTDPTRYLECIHRLLQSFITHCDTTRIPLLVNLDGWVKGLGLQVLQAVLQQQQPYAPSPTHVVQILGDLKSRQFDLVPPGATTCTDDADSIATTKIHVCYAYHSKHSPQEKRPMSRSSSFLSNTATSDDNNNNTNDSNNEMPNSPSGSVEDDDTSENDNDQIDATTAEKQNQISQQHQQRPMVVAAHSMSLPSASLRTLRLLAYFLERHDESDDSLWQIWDRVGLGQTQQEGFLDADVCCEMAHRLAAARPYIVPMETVEIVFSNTELHNDICSEEGTWDALNGSIVGLLRKEPEWSGSDDDAVMSFEELAMLPCVGLGIVRAIDRVRRLFYILTPVPHNELLSVNVLSLANHSLTFPFESLYRGFHSDASPYMAFGDDKKKTTTVLGTDPMKSRNSIGRKSLVGTNR